MGRAPEQVDEFLAEWVEPVLVRYPEAAGAAPELRSFAENGHVRLPEVPGVGFEAKADLYRVLAPLGRT